MAPPAERHVVDVVHTARQTPLDEYEVKVSRASAYPWTGGYQSWTRTSMSRSPASASTNASIGCSR